MYADPEIILQDAAKLLAPPPALPIWAWAELRRNLGKDVTAKTGRYSVNFAPYQKEPQEAFTDPEVQLTILYWGKRLGKTETINNLHGATIEQDPCNILHCLPILESAKKWSKQFLMPMVRTTDYLKDVIRETGRREAQNTILSKQYPGGMISGVGANSATSFRQIQARVVTCDEIDAMENGPEGDPIILALGRAENYSESIQVLSSTATMLETSRIHAWYLRSDKRNWFAKSPCCGKSHVLAWANVKWPKDKPEEAHYECPDCHAKWDDVMRLKAIRAGEWRATAPFKGIRGYWLNGLNSVFPAKKGFRSKLHQFAQEFLDAYSAGEAARISWTNTFLCEPVEIKGEVIDKQPLLERREKYGPHNVPNAVCCIVAAVDVQGDRLEYELVGVGDAEETWGIEYGRIMGNPEMDETWRDLAGVLSRKLRRADGTELSITATAIDHGHKGHMVRKFIRECGIPRVYAVYGSAVKQGLLVWAHPNKRYRMNLYSVNTDAAKDMIFARLNLKDMGPRYMHFPKGHGYEEETKYFDQLTAEEKRIKYHHGHAVSYYHKDSGARNEALDLRVYGLACLDILRPKLDSIRSALESQNRGDSANVAKTYQLKSALIPEKPKSQIKPILPRLPRLPGMPGKNWATGWK